MFAALAVVLCLPSAAFAKITNDPRYADQQALWDQINVPNAWELTTGSRAVTVAVIDTGFDTEHEDLRANTWTNTRETPNNGIDDDGNGYVDDVHGWNFVEDNNTTRTPITSAADSVDAINHGSLVAGLIGAVGDNGLDGTGLNWNVSLMPLRAISNNGSGTTGNVIKAINYAIDNGADVINMSFVGDLNDSALKETFYRAYQRGIVVVAAAGNDRASGKGDLDSFPEYPACFDHGDTENWILGVTSVTGQNQLSSFANFGTCIDLVAPGETIFSTGRYAPDTGFTQLFKGPVRGTSFSSPLVAGAAALIKSVRPDWKAPEIIKVLLNTADPVELANPDFIGKLGYGRLNVGRAVQAALNAPVTSAQPVVTPVTPAVVQVSPTVPSAPLPPKKLFYVSGSQMFSLELLSGKNIYLGKIDTGKVLDFTSRYDSVTGQTTLAALTKQGSKYRISLFDEAGNALQEAVVQEAKLASSKGYALEGVRLLGAENGVQKIVLRATNARKKSTEIWFANSGGTVEKNVTFKNTVAGFDAAADGEKIVVAQLQGKKLVVTQIDTATLAETTWSLGVVTAVGDLRMGKILNGTSEQTALVIQQNGHYQRLIVDIGSQSYRREVLGSLKRGELWKVVVGDWNADGIDDVVFWKNTGGTFTVTDGRGAILQEITLPSLKSVLY